ncbi:dynamin family protein [Lapidilactobacillus luobeiensis]|uniref:dynamin family protein n=1 Tax=Lapidilactobacillus luobeiensis TaxID=2950371 RepID=UPI0021C40164|nr:dynamin family protein [Lapidilactobacillus luobeiensis]
MYKLEDFSISYPQIRHPIKDESVEFKKHYLFVVYYFLQKFRVNPTVAAFQTNSLNKALDGPQDMNWETLHLDVELEKIHHVSYGLSNRFVYYREQLVLDVLFFIYPLSADLIDLITKEIMALLPEPHRHGGDWPRKSLDLKKQILTIPEPVRSAWQANYLYRSQNMRNITFTATMSAGKSSLINAIIGRRIAPAKKAACTAAVNSYLTSPIKSDLLNLAIGGNRYLNISLDDAKDPLSNHSENFSEVVGRFYSTLSDQKIQLIDTPGVDSVDHVEHRDVTFDYLKKAQQDLLIYVMPVSFIGSERDFNYLKFIKEQVTYRRIVFIVSMMDMIDLEDDSVDEILLAAKKLLEKIGFEHSDVLPISAYAGLLLKRKMLNLALSDDELEDAQHFTRQFRSKGLRLGEYYPNWEDDGKQIGSEPSADQQLKQAYLNTGLLGFEDLLIKDIEENQNA